MLPGLFRAIQARSRSASLASLVLYLATLLVMGFGHRCADHLVAGPGLSARTSGASPALHAKSSTSAGQHCLACTWHRSTIGLLPVTLPVFVPQFAHARPPGLLVAVPASASIPRVSRGPPHA